MQTKTKQTIVTALALTFTLTTAAFAQDVIGAAAVSTAAQATMKVIAGAGVAWGFLRLMSGRHTVEGLTMLGTGALGLAKTSAIVGLLGSG